MGAMSNKATIETFTAIDFETAHGDRSSICQVGLVKVNCGEIVDRLELLVQPPSNFYWNSFTDIHGITPEDTKDAPPFDVVWPTIKPFIVHQNVVAHNGSFDFSCLQQTLEFYGLRIPDYEKFCTYQIYRKSLKVLCLEHAIELNHHNALSDAMACAKLFSLHLARERSTLFP